MSLFEKLKKLTGLSPASETVAAPEADNTPKFEIPAELPRLSAADAEGMAAFFPEHSSADLATTAPEQLHQLLNQDPKPIESMRYLAQNLDRETAMYWTVQSVEQVEPSLPEADKKAFAAAKFAIADPSPEHLAAAESSAKAGEIMGPGAWAAIAAVAQTAAEGGSSEDIFAEAVAGAVMLAAAYTQSKVELPTKLELPEPVEAPAPEMDMMAMPQLVVQAIPAVEAPVLDAEELNQAMALYKPFIDNALQLAAG